MGFRLVFEPKGGKYRLQGWEDSWQYQEACCCCCPQLEDWPIDKMSKALDDCQMVRTESLRPSHTAHYMLTAVDQQDDDA